MQDNEWTSWGMGNMDEQVNKPQTTADHRKLSCKGGSAQLYIAPEVAKLSVLENGILIGKDGIILNGNMHLARDISKIRLNGFWVFNDELLTTLPSSIYTPIPVLKYKEPAFATIVGRLASAMA